LTVGSNSSSSVTTTSRVVGSPVSNPVSCAWYIVTICLSGESCVTSTTKKNYKISHHSIHREIVSLRTYTMYNLTWLSIHARLPQEKLIGKKILI
jgi:hypothetical protein